MSKFKGFNIFLVSFAIAISSCTLPSTTSVNRVDEQNDLSSFVKPASLNSPQNQQIRPTSSEKVTFPSMVQTTPLEENQSLPEERDLNSLIEQIEAEDDFSTSSFSRSRLQLARFTSKKARTRRDVQIPETGEFELILREGSEFNILDNDATDGQATLELPAGTMDTWLRLQPNRKRQGTLTVEDKLYYVTDTLNNRLFERWARLGRRPLPVPSDWNSPDGNNFVLRFTANEVKSFYISWLYRGKEATLPPGVGAIGVDGGTIELPGVATVMFGKNAVDTDTIFSIRQKEDMPSTHTIDRPLEVYAGPPIEISPKVGLNSNVLINISIFDSYISSPPLNLTYSHFEPSNNEWRGLARFVTQGVAPDVEDWFSLMQGYSTGIIVPLVTKDFTVGLEDFEGELDNEGFSIQQVSQKCSTGFQNYSYDGVFVVDPCFKQQALIDVAAETGWQYFKNYQTQLPIRGNIFQIKSSTCPSISPDCVSTTFYGISIKPAGGAVTNKNPETPNSYHIYLPSDANQTVNVDVRRHTTLHEVFHLFQFVDLSHQQYKKIFTVNFSEKLNPQVAIASHGWIYESSARYMGARAFYDKYQTFYPGRSVNTATGLSSFYSKGEGVPNYGKSVMAGIRDFSLSNSLYNAPKIDSGLGLDPEDVVSKYGRVNLFAVIGEQFGVQKVVDICRTYSKKGHFNLFSAINTLADELPLRSSTNSFFEWFVYNSFAKNYGLGTDKANLQKIEGGPFRNLNVDLDIPFFSVTKDSYPKNKYGITLNLNQINSPRELSSKLSSLSTQMFFLDVDKEASNIVIYLDEATSGRLSQPATEELIAKGLRAWIITDLGPENEKPELVKVQNKPAFYKIKTDSSNKPIKTRIFRKKGAQVVKEDTYALMLPKPKNTSNFRVVLAVNNSHVANSKGELVDADISIHSYILANQIKGQVDSVPTIISLKGQILGEEAIVVFSDGDNDPNNNPAVPVAVEFLSDEEQQVKVQLPDGAVTGPVVVTTNGIRSNEVYLEINRCEKDNPITVVSSPTAFSTQSITRSCGG